MNHPPHSIEAESAVLSAVLLYPESIATAEALLDPADFYKISHGRLYAEMLHLARAQKPIDVVSLAGRGVDTRLVADLSGAATTAEALEYHCQIVRDHAGRRAVIRVADRLMREAQKGTDSADGIISAGLADLSACFSGASGFRHIGDYARDWYEDARARMVDPDNARPLGVATGIGKLNELLSMSGLARGHMTVIGAESSHGKSALLDNGIVLPAAMRGARCCLCSLEDEGRAVFARHLSSLTGIQNRQLQQERVEAHAWPDVQKATDKIAGLDIWILDVVPAGVDKMVAQIRRHLQEHPADLLGIDYLQFVGAGVRTESKTAASEYVITSIARLARELKDTATVLLSQYRKIEKDAQPRDDDLRDANAVRYFAHAIIHIWNPKRNGASELGCRALKVSKNKNGPVGIVVAGWVPKTVTFRDPDPSEAERYRDAAGIDR